MNLLDTLKQARTALQPSARTDQVYEAITNLTAAIEMMQGQKPVAWMIPGSITQNPDLAKANGDYATPLYLHPQDTAPAIPEVDCAICTNRGGIYKRSQESNCEHCLWQGHWHKSDLYAAPAPEGEK